LINEGALRYIAKIQVYAAYDPLNVDFEDATRDHTNDIREILKRCEVLSEEELMRDVYVDFQLDLCRPCQRSYIKDPLSTDLPYIDRIPKNFREAGDGQIRKPKILVTDDCESTLDCLKTVLEPCGYEVVTLANKVEALKRLREIQPDLVTTDLASPQIGGIDFIRVVKELDPSIPVIILSGNVTLESAREAVRLGVCDCIDKPFDVVYFRQAVETALKTRRAR
jgi:CheY-like chemotaxis protein